MVEWKVSLYSFNFLCIARVSSNFPIARFGALTVVLLKIPVFYGVMLCHGRVVHNISKVRGTWIFSVKLDCLALKLKAVLTFEVLGTICPTHLHHTNLQQYHSQNFKYQTLYVSSNLFF
jgi:hypothetical protein